MSAEELERLLVVQEHDIALDRLRHRRVSLPERAELDVAAPRARDARRRARRSRRSAATGVRAEERRLDDEAQAVGARAEEADKKLYSGTVSSPRELQAMQADIDMLKRHRSDLEDRELEVMEARESLDGEIGALDAKRAALEADATRLAAVIAAAEAEIDAEAGAEAAARAEVAGGIAPTCCATTRRRRRRTAARARRGSSGRRARRATSRSRRPRRSASGGPRAKSSRTATTAAPSSCRDQPALPFEPDGSDRLDEVLDLLRRRLAREPRSGGDRRGRARTRRPPADGARDGERDASA